MKRNFMKKALSLLLSCGLVCTAVFAFSSCGNTEKNITVVVREKGSGTREAFDTVVTDGTHRLEEKDASGKKVYHSTSKAVEQTKTGTVLSAVAADKNAIGYISLGSVNDTIRVLKVNGVTPTEESVLNGTYKIQRPFVVMTNAALTANNGLTPITADFLTYLKSAASADAASSAGCIYLADPVKRANAGSEPIPVADFTKQATLPEGGKIVVRGSTSMEKFITAAAKAYAAVYGVSPESIFDIQLEGSSVGRKAAEQDTTGNVIGLSSAAVQQDNISSFNVCLDAVAVIVNKDNTAITDLTLGQLYDIFSGKTEKFSQVSGN